MRQIEGFRLSSQQGHLWLLRKHGGDHVSQCTVSLEGECRVDLFEAALRAVIRKHEILRTRFDFLPGMDLPLQVIAEDCEFSSLRVDLTKTTTVGVGGEIERLLEQQRRVDFDYVHGPLARFLLLGSAPDRWLLAITLPAMCADSPSLENIVREIGRAYAAGLGSEPSDDQEVIQYVQFSEWQNELLEAPEADEGRRYWSQKAVRDGAVSTLPFEGFATARPRSRSIIELEIGEQRAVAAERAALEHGVSLQSVFLCCWGLLLGKLTDRSKLVLEVLFDGRSLEELAEGIGAFGKYIPILIRFRSGRPFARELKRVDALLREAQKWEELFVPALENIEEGGCAIGFDFEHAGAPVSRRVT
ncbi:MAG: hypothetical protein HC897_12990 [Thermoanaerobaculia bacterium]|nr:hypothetical protein [Thermoanaerobaculia bacterium]